MKVLIVDDNGPDRKLLRLNLERHGCEAVIEAADGQEGLDLARAHKPDLIISDALMPKLDGFEFLRQVKTDRELKNIPFIFYSAVYTGVQDEGLATHLGAEAFITKPKEPELFWREISAILARLAAGRFGRAPSGPPEEEQEYLREYSGVVAAKLEQKVRELEESLSRRRVMEEKLVKLSIAVAQSPVSIVITDPNGLIEFVNPKFTQITGYEFEEVFGCNPRILKSGQTPPETYSQLWEAISAGNVWHGEFLNRKKNGELFLEHATIAPVKNLQGEITNFIAIKEDITERRNLEDQLRHAQKMEAIGTLAGGVAHDFNNILTAIIGFASLLEMKLPPDDPLHHHVTQILASSDRAAKLTRSLLALSRKQQIETRVMDLNDIIRGLEKMLRRLIREDIDLTITTSAEPLKVMVDGGQVEQVLINLVTNARDAMPDGGVLSISSGSTRIDGEFTRLHGYGEEGEYALIVVADNGMGMDEKVHQRIFDPFFTTKEVGKGTGLGLSVCYGIVKQHGGYIRCDSEPSRGTTFFIHLPLVSGELPVAGGDGAVSPATGSETILLAEDDSAVRELVTHLLQEFGYRVISAGDGEEAVAKFREARGGIDLCLFDVIMPKVKGWVAVEEIRKSHPAVRVLFMSGYQAEDSRQEWEGKEKADFIAKPVNPRELLRRVRELLDG